MDYNTGIGCRTTNALVEVTKRSHVPPPSRSGSDFYTIGLVRGLSVTTPGSVELNGDRYAVFNINKITRARYPSMAKKTYTLFPDSPFCNFQALVVYTLEGPTVSPNGVNPGCGTHVQYTSDCRDCALCYSTRDSGSLDTMDDRAHRFDDNLLAYSLFNLSLLPINILAYTLVSQAPIMRIENKKVVWGDLEPDTDPHVIRVGANMRLPTITIRSYTIKFGSTFVAPTQELIETTGINIDRGASLYDIRPYISSVTEADSQYAKLISIMLDCHVIIRS